jgi:hypothetical protein
VEGSCEHGNEPSDSINFWEALEWLNNWRLLKKDSAPSCQLVSYFLLPRQQNNTLCVVLIKLH